MNLMQRTGVSGLAFVLLSTLFCFGMGKPVKPESPTASDKLFDYQKTTLDNGMAVITLEDFSAPIVAVQLWYHVGSKDEQPDRQGYAHMFEHMMFKGTDRVEVEDHFGFIRKVGGTTNAYTSYDQTVYTQTLPARELELALWLEAERMAFLKIDQEAMDTERKVIEEELRMGENRPYGTVFKKMVADLFTHHPYRWTPIGNIAHLRATSVGDLRAFWETYYLPNNATLVIVGAVKHAEAQALAERYFGWIDAGPEPSRVDVEEPAPASPRTIVIDDENAPAGRVSLTWRTVPIDHPDATALEFLSEILGGGSSSRVYRRLVADDPMAVGAASWAYHLQQAGIFNVHATLPAGSGHYETALAALAEQIASVQADGVTDEELEKARNQLLKRSVTEALTVEDKAQLLGRAAVTMGDISRVNTLLADIRAVTAADVQRVANQWLDKHNVFRFIIKENPDGMAATKLDDEDAPMTAKPESSPPAPGRAGVERPSWFPETAPFAEFGSTVFDLPFKEAKLGNGLTVLVVTNHDTPFVSATLGLANGAWTEHKLGLAAMTLAMLTRGTENYTEAELSGTLEQYAISLSGAAEMDDATLAMDALTEHLERGVELMAEVALRPAFDADQFDRLRRQEITGLQIRRQDPRYVAQTGFNRVVYGAHPYGRPVKGTPAALEQLTPDDLKLWHRKFFRPDQATLIFAGDITLGRAVALTDAHFGKWRTTLVETGLVLPDIPEPAPTQITLINRPGSAQAQLHIGHLGVTRRQQPDYFYALLTGNYFGGSFNSRLNDTVRVQRGLTYSVHGWFNPMRTAGTFEISTFTRNDAVAETIEVIVALVEQLRTVAPSESEFEQTRSALLGSFARHRQTPQQIARDLWMIRSQGLSDDYLRRLFGAIEKAGPQDCVEFTQETIMPDKLAIVVVGDAAVLKERLAAIGPVEVVDIE